MSVPPRPVCYLYSFAKLRAEAFLLGNDAAAAATV